MKFTNTLSALAALSALSHALILPPKEGDAALLPYKGKYICTENDWLVDPTCCQTQVLVHLYDECEPVERFVGKEKKILDPCGVGRAKKPACCEVPVEERFAKSKKRFEECLEAETIEE